MEIKVNDLRSGNLILNRHGEAEEVDWMTFKDMCQPRMSGHGYTGIPLTPEWLERLGFISDFKGFTRHSYYLEINPRFGYTIRIRDTAPLTGFRYIGDHIEHIKCVHQLQNLYHALTGCELEISPETT